MKLTNKEEEKQIEEEQAAKTRYWNIPACYDDDDDDYTIAITPKEPDNSLSMGNEHLDTISVTESDEFIKSSVENLVPNPRIDFLFDEFAGELTLLKSIPPGINETDCDPKNETRFIKILLYDNSSPRLPKEFVFENSDAAIESFSPSPIPVEDSDSLMEETDLSFTPDDPMPRPLRKMTMTLKGIFSSLKNCLAMIPFHFLKMSHFILIFLHPLVLLQNHQMEKSSDLLSHLGHEAF
nr:hypothetical protein [Tanacetum cinerariifolium]